MSLSLCFSLFYLIWLCCYTSLSVTCVTAQLHKHTHTHTLWDFSHTEFLLFQHLFHCASSVCLVVCLCDHLPLSSSLWNQNPPKSSLTFCWFIDIIVDFSTQRSASFSCLVSFLPFSLCSPFLMLLFHLLSFSFSSSGLLSSLAFLTFLTLPLSSPHLLHHLFQPFSCHLWHAYLTCL